MSPVNLRRPRFEVCAGSLPALEAALAVGADRVELCAALEVGGVTPSIAMIETAVALAGRRTKVHVLVRPREGDFVYSPRELDVMCRDVLAAKGAGADGIVVGALDRQGAVDREACERLVALARPASVTFHRAFDEAAAPLAAFEDVKALGVDRLLTSGAAPDVLTGAPVLAELVRRAGKRLVVLPGGGVTEANAGQVLSFSGATELHFSGRATGADDERPLVERLAAIMAAAVPALVEGEGAGTAG